MKLRIKIIGVLAAATAAGALVASIVTTTAVAGGNGLTFTMVRSAAAEGANCLRDARATVRVYPQRFNEVMTIRAYGLPPRTNFDLFILQVPNAPFGVSWYQSDLRSDSRGRATVRVIGRFNIETFAVAPGSTHAPDTHPTIDATSNPAFAPIHTYHVGFWFNTPAEATAAGCPGATTPFNGDHTAGVQAMSTRNFPDLAGPLSQLGS
ncbi:hypothetical protein ACFFWC_00385 [Plantactinospora siamensis]|uniref:Uncharacterized protein n=1 Tax=Plantactinospora siamensis TaxID=555372 RepID=A0ABV6NTS0_9ACTN